MKITFDTTSTTVTNVRKASIELSFYFVLTLQVSAVAPEPPKVLNPPKAPVKNMNTSEATGDFNEDPFKNYRYEDPFMIADPFQDEEILTVAAEGKLNI